MIEINKIYNESCLDTMSKMSDDFIDLTVTSPPYNVDLGNNKHNKNPYDLYKDNLPHHQYLEWLTEIFTLLYAKTKYSGRCVINIGDSKNGSVPTHSDVIQRMSNIGWIPMTTIVWQKNNCGSRTAWGSFCSPSAPSFPTPFEYILVFAKGDRKLQYSGVADISKEDYIAWSLAYWTFNGASLKKIGHPAAFPVELPYRCIKMLSWLDSIIYDPFMGSGTTAIAALKTNRKYIGSEISFRYCQLAEERIKNECGSLYQ